MSTTDLPGSSLLANRYRLVERLGAGGMSVVWRGFDEVLGRQVAVKVLPPSTSADPAFRRRLRAEAQAAARLSHPHITNVYDYGEATTADGEPVPYVVMELVDGESLAAVLARVRRLPWPAAVRICAEVSAALAGAHARGIVHRDVTPANVMLTSTGAKVVDFGISALIGENDIDPDGSLLGTPAYLAPERLEGGQVSPATDVYAVGLLIYRTLIGQLPWDVGTTTALLRAHQYTEPEPLPPVEGLPPAVSALVERCLEKRPDDRPASAELAEVLAGISAGAPVTRGYVPDWAENGEDTTILPTPYQYTDGIGRVRPGHARVADAIPVQAGRGVAAVRAADGPAASAEGPGGSASAAEAHVAGAESMTGRAPHTGAESAAHRGIGPVADRNNRFGSLPPTSSAPPVEPAAGPLRPAALGASPAHNEVAAQHSGGATTPPYGSGPAADAPAALAKRSQGRRMLLGAATVLLVGAAAYGWSMAASTGASGDPAAKILPGPSVVAAAGRCVVSYAVLEDNKKTGRFEAMVTVANRQNIAIKNWSLWFIMPGGQTMSGGGEVQLDQQGGQVTVRSESVLSPQKAATMTLNGRYAKGANPPPMTFAVGPDKCETYVSDQPGEPSRPVEELSNGQTRLGPPVGKNPPAGIRVTPGGLVVPVPGPVRTVGPSRSTSPVPSTTSDPGPSTGPGTGPGPGPGTGGSQPVDTCEADPTSPECEQAPGPDQQSDEVTTPPTSASVVPPPPPPSEATEPLDNGDDIADGEGGMQVPTP